MSYLLADKIESNLSKRTNLMKSNVITQQFSVALVCYVISVLCLAAGPTDSRSLLPGGDFQKCAENSKGPSGWDSNGRVVKDPRNPQNLVMQITGPDEMGFECPLNLPAGVQSVRVSFRILVPAGLKFDPEVPDAKGVRLRVTLYDKGGSSGFKERIIAPAADWQEVHFDWDNIGAGRARLGIEALWHADSIYFDDVRVSNRSTDPMK
jgi:hypothetical protein